MEPKQKEAQREAPLPNPHAKSFTEIVREIDRGRVLPEVEQMLQDVVKAVKVTGKKGRVRLDIEVKLVADNQLTLTAKPSATIPKPDPNATLYFTDDDNHLMRRDPKQYEMDLAPVAPKPLRPREDPPSH